MSRCILKNGDIIKDTYIITKSLGRGSYGDVYECIDKNTNFKSALKINKLGRKYIDSIETEMKILKRLNNLITFNNDNQYIPKLYDNFKYNSHTCFNLKLYDLNLYEFLKQYYYDDLYDENLVLSLIIKLVNAMFFINSNNIIHCDLKPENIMFTIDRTDIVVCDFGLSEITYDKLSEYKYDVQSMWYRAPEIALCLPYNYKIDIWSIGTIMYEILFKKPLFPCRDNDKLIQLITSFINVPENSLIYSDSNWSKYFSIIHYNVTLRNNTITKKISIDRNYLLRKYNNKKLVDNLCNIINKILVWDMNKRIDYENILKELYEINFSS